MGVPVILISNVILNVLFLGFRVGLFRKLIIFFVFYEILELGFERFVEFIILELGVCVF